MIFFIGAFAVLAVIILVIASLYNTLVRLRNRFKNAFSQIDVQLKRRYDLIPNLVETAKGYLKFERETLEAVIKARNQAVSANQQAAANPANADAMRGMGAAETVLSGAMGKFLALAEAYPDLKGNQDMARLMEELTSTENRIAFARQAYNDSVMEYNTTREQFPSSMIAGTFGFAEAGLLQATSTPEEREPVKVKFT